MYCHVKSHRDEEHGIKSERNNTKDEERIGQERADSEIEKYPNLEKSIGNGELQRSKSYTKEVHSKMESVFELQ